MDVELPQSDIWRESFLLLNYAQAQQQQWQKICSLRPGWLVVGRASLVSRKGFNSENRMQNGCMHTIRISDGRLVFAPS